MLNLCSFIILKYFGQREQNGFLPIDLNEFYNQSNKKALHDSFMESCLKFKIFYHKNLLLFFQMYYLLKCRNRMNPIEFLIHLFQNSYLFCNRFFFFIPELYSWFN
jgi:hypothetical protein